MAELSVDRVFVGVGKAVAKVPEWHARQYMRVYDRFFAPKPETEEERAVALETRKSIEKRAKAAGWVVTGVLAAAVTSTAIVIFRKLQRGGGEPIVAGQPILPSPISEQNTSRPSVLTPGDAVISELRRPGLFRVKRRIERDVLRARLVPIKLQIQPASPVVESPPSSAMYTKEALAHQLGLSAAHVDNDPTLPLRPEKKKDWQDAPKRITRPGKPDQSARRPIKPDKKSLISHRSKSSLDDVQGAKTNKPMSDARFSKFDKVWEQGAKDVHVQPLDSGGLEPAVITPLRKLGNQDKKRTAPDEFNRAISRTVKRLANELDELFPHSPKSQKQLFILAAAQTLVSHLKGVGNRSDAPESTFRAKLSGLLSESMDSAVRKELLESFTEFFAAMWQDAFRES